MGIILFMHAFLYIITTMWNNRAINLRFNSFRCFRSSYSHLRNSLITGFTLRDYSLRKLSNVSNNSGLYKNDNVLAEKKLLNLEFLDFIISQNDNNNKIKIPNPFHVIQLNQPLLSNCVDFYSKAKSLTIADGAANYLYELNLNQINKNCKTTKPTLICGDLDSIKGEVLEYYMNSQVPIIYNKDQDTTDTMKCWKILKSKLQPHENIIIMCGLGGRLDHSMGNIAFMFKLLEHESLDNNLVMLIDHDSLCFVIPEGKVTIQLPKVFVNQRCGLIPVGKPCKSTISSGLKYNLSGQSMEMSGMISACNEIVDNPVNIEASDKLLWYSQRSGL